VVEKVTPVKQVAKVKKPAVTVKTKKVEVKSSATKSNSAANEFGAETSTSSNEFEQDDTDW